MKYNSPLPSPSRYKIEFINIKPCVSVPFYMDGGELLSPIHDPALCDVAPTILSLLDLSQPPAMTGVSLAAS